MKILPHLKVLRKIFPSLFDLEANTDNLLSTLDAVTDQATKLTATQREAETTRAAVHKIVERMH